MPTLGSATFSLRTDASQLIAGNKAAEASTASTVARMNAKMETIGAGLSRTGAAMTRKLTLPILAAGGAATKLALDYNKSFTDIDALVGASAKQINLYKKNVLTLAKEGTVGPNELAKALFFVTSSGFEGAAALKVLKASATASTAGLGNTATIADAVTSAVSAYGESNLTAARAVDIMTGTIRTGKGEPTELAGVLGRVIPVAEAMGVEFDEVGASLAAMSLQGIDFNEGATAIRGAMTGILKPTKETREFLEDAGTSIDELRTAVKEKGLVPVLQRLRDTFGDNKDALGKLFPNVRALNGFLALTGANSKRTAKIQEELRKNFGETSRAAGKALKDPSNQIKQAFVQLQVAAIQVGNVLIPIVTKIVGKVGELATAFSKLSPEQQKLILIALGVVAALGPVISIVGKLVLVIRAVSIAFTFLAANPIVAALLLIAATFVILWTRSQTFRDIVRSVLAVVQAVFKTTVTAVIVTMETLVAAWRALSNAVRVIWTAIKTAITTALNVIRTVITTEFNIYRTIITTTFNVIKTVAVAAWNVIKTVITTALNVIKTAIMTTFNVYKTVILTAWNVIKTATIAAWNAVKTPVVGAINFVRDKLGGLLGFIRGVGEKMLGVARSVGTAIVDGIKQGVLSVWDSLTGFITSKMEALKGFIKRPWKIFSPSQVSAEMGANIGKGLELGLIQSLGPLGDKLSSAMNRIIERGRAAVAASRGRLADAFGQVADAVLRTFDSRTEAGLARIEGRLRGKFGALLETRQTPTEKVLAGIEAGLAQKRTNEAVTDAQAQLATAQAGEEGKVDPAAVLSAQKQLEDAQVNLLIFNLQRKAELERAAEEKRTAAANVKFQTQLARQQLEFSSQREVQRINLDQQLNQFKAKLDARGLTAAQSNQRLLGIMNSFNVSFKGAGEALGQAVARGLRASIADVVAAAQELANAAAAAAGAAGFVDAAADAADKKKASGGKKTGKKKSGGGGNVPQVSFGDIGKRAFGGPAAAGAPLLVGERGPELFVPDLAGRVVSNRDLAGMLESARAGATSRTPAEALVSVQGDLVVREEQDAERVASLLSRKVLTARTA